MPIFGGRLDRPEIALRLNESTAQPVGLIERKTLRPWCVRCLVDAAEFPLDRRNYGVRELVPSAPE